MVQQRGAQGAAGDQHRAVAVEEARLPSRLGGSVGQADPVDLAERALPVNRLTRRSQVSVAS